jgi:hypothetical protein
MTVLQHIACPCGIIRAIVILVVARLLLTPAQEFFFVPGTRLEAYLLLATFMDLFSRSAGVFAEISEKKEEGKTNLRAILPKVIEGLSSSNYGGLLLVPVWFGCLLIYFLK